MANNITRGRKRLTVFLVSILTITGAGVAYAYWTSIGSGVGSATTGQSVALTITSQTAVGTLSPGSAGQTIDFSVTNPGEGTQYLTAVTVAIADATGTAWVPTGTCLLADYTATISTAPVAGAIAPGASVPGVATVTLTNTGANQDDCQGQVVPLYFVAS